MSCERFHDCDDAILDRLNGVDSGSRFRCAERDSFECDDRTGVRGDSISGRRRKRSDRNSADFEDRGGCRDVCGGIWQDACAGRRRRRTCCDFCWLWSRCPYRDGIIRE